MVSELRKKRDEERKLHSREILLTSAGRIFASNGYHNTLISDIVAEGGVGQGTFYRHFSSKREVFEIIFDRFMEELLNQFEEMSENLPASLEEYREASLKAVGRMAALIEKNRDITLMFIREGASIDREFQEKIAGMTERFAQLARFYLDHAVSNGFARPCRSDIVALSLVGMGLQLFDSWGKGLFPSLTVEEIISEAVDFAFQGLGLHKAEEVPRS